MRLTGIPVSPGIAVGTPQIVHVRNVPVIKVYLPESRLDHEIERLRTAIDATVREIEAQKASARSILSEDFLAIFDVHTIILKDPALINGAVLRIKRERVNAEYALQGAMQDMVRGLTETEDPYFQERATDVDDLHRRVQLHLSGPLPERDIWTGDNLVILAETLTPSETSALHNAPIVGFATERGARTSHTAIIARSLEIPAVVGVKGLMASGGSTKRVIVDGLQGVVILDPSDEEVEEYQRRKEAYGNYRSRILANARQEARTVDGHRILVSANIDLSDEVDSALTVGANGCGLYRSEFLYLSHSPELPSEEQHQRHYEKIAEAFYPHRVVIRTLDLGGEKYFHAVLDRREHNPVLGVRAIRFCLRHPDIFKTQLRGLLRASQMKNVAILFPLITTFEEFEQARSLLETCKEELRSEGIPFDENVPLGIMVEVPSCALTAASFAPHVDFFSIGTNDLIQYLLAIDRNNDSVAHLYDPLHPAVLECIGRVCEAAVAAGKHVSVCGEAAADPSIIPLLVGYGVEELSMTPSAILEVKDQVRNLSFRSCQKLVKKIRKVRTSREISEKVRAFLNGGSRSV